MGDLTTLHSQAKRLVLTIREGLETLETSECGARSVDVQALARELRVKHADLQRIASELESVWRMFVVREAAGKRAVWKGKVSQVVEEVDAIRRTLDKYGSREQRRAAEQAERQELLARADAGRRAKTDMDEEAQAAGSIHRSKRALDEIFETGTNILGSMAASRERLKAAQRKLLDVLNSVGIGDTLLRLIERRQRMDIWMTYGGMVVVVLVMLLLLWFFRR
ncbi:Qb-snare protein, Bos1/Membrin family [Haematococcus lacustris]|nr:hypothetical protein QJQ45_029399 [Haematococcus lacustris]